MAKGALKGGAYPKKTPDGKEIVYVSVPRVADEEAERRYRHADVLAGTRLQLVSHARELVTYHRATADETSPITLAQKVDLILEVAHELETYVLGGVE